MARTKPAPPPNPTLPLLTLDTLLTILLRPLLSPTTSLLPPLCLLALRHPHNLAPVFYSLIYTALTLLLQAFVALDGRLAGGEARKLNWEDEVVLITGGAGGLGTCLAEVFALRGVGVAVVDVVSEEEFVGAVGDDREGHSKGDDVKRKGEGSGREKRRTRKDAWEDVGCTYYACDVGDRGEVEELRARVEADLGPPTILINAAALVSLTPLLSLAPETLDRNIRVNLLSHFHTIQTFLPAMLARPHGGTIVTISSVLGYLGCAGLADYTATKAALTNLHHSLTAEMQLMPASSRVNTILATPGQLSTPLFSRITPPSTFFGPVITPAALAAAIVGAVDEGKDAEIAMPLYARAIGFWGILPSGLRRWMRGLVGLDAAGWNAIAQKKE